MGCALEWLSTLLATAGVYLVHPAVNLLLCVNPFLFLSLLLSHFRFSFTLQKKKNKFCSVGSSMEGPCKQTFSWFRPPFFFVFVVVSAPFPIQQSSPFDRIWSFYLHMCSALRIWKKLPCSRDETPENNRNMSSLILNEGFEFSKFYRVKIVRLIPHVDSSFTPPSLPTFTFLKNFNHDVTRSFKYFLCVQLTLSLCSHLK